MNLKRSPFLICIAIFLLQLFVGGCEYFQPNDEDLVLARVHNQTLTLQEAVHQAPRSLLNQDTLLAVRHVKEEWIENQIFEREAVRLGLNRNQDVQLRLDRLRSRLLKNALREYLLNRHEEDLFVSREEASEYFQANKERFILDENYIRFRHLTTRTVQEAEQARQQLLGGVPWGEVVDRFSIRPEQQLQQSDHFWPASTAASEVPMMNRYLGIIGIREISPIESYGGSYHFVQKMEERPEGDHPELEWLIDQIAEWLYLERSRRLINSYYRNLYLQAQANNELHQMNVEEMDLEIIRSLLNRND